MKDPRNPLLAPGLTALGLALLTISWGCGGGPTDQATSGGSSALGGGGQTGSGGGAAGSPTGGGSPSGGSGASSTGGTTGGSGTGGSSAGGTSPMGGMTSGGTSPTTGGSGGSPSTGGAASGAPNGGQATGGVITDGGGPPTGGTAGGGMGGSTGGSGSGELAFDPVEGIFSYVRNEQGPTQSFRLRNDGSASVSVTALDVGGNDAALFGIVSPPTLPAAIAPGADLEVEVEFRTNQNPPPAPPADDGGVPVDAVITATTDAGNVDLGLFGLVVTAAGMVSGGEATLGQSLSTLGYAVNVGNALRDHLENGISSTPQGDEVSAQRFVKAGSGPVTLMPVARWSPSGAMPYGYYTGNSPSCPSGCEEVGTMTTNNDAITSNGSRMLLPPLDAAGMTGTFDPGDASFGIWAYTDQVSQNVSTGGDAQNGDYCYTTDAANSPASRAHRVRVWPLRDRAGTAIPNAYLLGMEEAGNGDYNDYVLTISNVSPAP